MEMLETAAEAEAGVILFKEISILKDRLTPGGHSSAENAA
jgi:hypothetical protein